jgi:hypothetical protein
MLSVPTAFKNYSDRYLLFGLFKPYLYNYEFKDQLTASLFRSFLLAERIMAENNCHVVSQPVLPSVFSHPLWNHWEYTIDVYLNNITQVREPKQNVYIWGRNEFFNQTSFRNSCKSISIELL